MLTELRDRHVIEAWCRRRPAVNAYLLGDLDDFFWPHTRWFAWEGAAGVEHVALLYVEHDPVLLALPDPEWSASWRAFLGDLEPALPDVLDAHLGSGGTEALAGSYAVTRGPLRHQKLGLSRLDRLEALDTADVELLGVESLEEVLALYGAAYPGTWFQPRMLETRRYAGIRQDGHLVCVAGVHAWSPAYRVATLGNVATLPAARGRGLATAACARLCRVLLADGIETIALNVAEANAPARAAYARLGFAEVAAYVECSLARVGSSGADHPREPG